MTVAHSRCFISICCTNGHLRPLRLLSCCRWSSHSPTHRGPGSTVLVHTEAVSGGGERSWHFRTPKQTFPSGAALSLLGSAPGRPLGMPLALFVLHGHCVACDGPLPSWASVSWPVNRGTSTPCLPGLMTCCVPEPGHSRVKPGGLPRVLSSLG